MKKTITIIKREYLTRIQKRSFLAVSFLIPVLIYLGVMSFKKFKDDPGNGFTKFYVIDQTDNMFSNMSAIGNLKPELLKQEWSEAKKLVKTQKQAILLNIPADFEEKRTVNIFSDRNIGENLLSSVKEQLQQHSLQNAIAKAGLKQLATGIFIQQEIASSEGGNKNYKVLGIVGFGAAMVVYLAVFLYSAQVMRGVVEEKSSKIIEIIVSSVSTFELMLGKVIGVGLVGLTQFIIWILLFYLAMTYTGEGKLDLSPLLHIGLAYNLPVLLCLFLFYFGCGYFLYSAVFAAVGSIADNEADSQSFVAPVTSPLIFTIALMQTAILNNPASDAAYWLSIIPFTSPIAMIARLPFGVPLNELIISMGILLITFVLMTGLASKVYSIGILSSGNRLSLKQVLKWSLIRK